MCISQQSCLEAEIQRFSYVLPVMAVIFDLPATPMLKSVHTSPEVLLDPANLGIAFGILLLSCMKAEI